MLRFSLRLLLFLIILLHFLIRQSDEGGERPATRQLIRRTLMILGIHVRIRGKRFSGPALLVSNHISYLDPLIFLAHQPVRCVTSFDTGAVGFFGILCRQIGCLFINRNQPRTVTKQIRQFREILTKQQILFFPEGTSSSGNKVLPFHSALFAAAPNHLVQPCALRYCTVNGKAYQKNNHHYVAWYGNMRFLPHLLRLLCQESVNCELNFLEPIVAEIPRKEKARISYQQIQQRAVA